MRSIGIGEIQRNTAMFANLTEAIQIVDKRKKQILAMVYPTRNQRRSNDVCNGVVNNNKTILHEALTIIEAKNIDFVDALICAKSNLQGYGEISFDNDVEKC